MTHIPSAPHAADPQPADAVESVVGLIPVVIP